MKNKIDWEKVNLENKIFFVTDFRVEKVSYEEHSSFYLPCGEIFHPKSKNDEKNDNFFQKLSFSTKHLFGHNDSRFNSPVEESAR